MTHGSSPVCIYCITDWLVDVNLRDVQKLFNLVDFVSYMVRFRRVKV